MNLVENIAAKGEISHHAATMLQTAVCRWCLKMRLQVGKGSEVYLRRRLRNGIKLYHLVDAVWRVYSIPRAWREKIVTKIGILFYQG